MNKVILMGRLTAVPELRQTPSGVNTVRFTIAVNRRFKDQNGNYPTDFIHCIAWRQTAEFIHRYFNKGSMIAIAGSIQTRSWDTQDGRKQFVTEVIVDEAHFASSKTENAQPIDTMPNYEDFTDIPDDDCDLPF